MAALLLTGLFVAHRTFALLLAIPVMLAALSRDERAVWGAAALVAAADLAARWSGGLTEAHEPPSVGWISTLQIGLVAALAHLWLRRQRETEARGVELEKLTGALRLHEAELLRHSQEERAQAERSARQSDELRRINADLTTRESLLERLLELSRSLGFETNRDEALAQIARAANLMLESSACVILEHRGSTFQVLAHAGFEPGAPAAATLPHPGSFAALVIAAGKTGSVENLETRPDLVLVQPANGETYGAVLGAPIVAAGVAKGVIEVHYPDTHEASSLDVSVLESLAVQASNTLQRARLAEAIDRERRRFEAALQAAPIGLAVSDDPRAEVVRLNPAGSALLGVASGENVSLAAPAGARILRRVRQDSRSASPLDSPLGRALRGEAVDGELTELLFPGRRRLALQVSSAPVLGPDGSTQGSVAAFADVSELKRLEREVDARRREAESASVRKTRFLAALSHDIRTPANAIGLLAELVQGAAAEDSAAEVLPRLTQRLKSSANALVQLVTAVLDFAQFESGIAKVEETEFELGGLLDEELTALAALASQKQLTLTVEPLETPIWLFSDRVKLARIVDNLVQNAIKFTAQGGVRVSAAIDDEHRVAIRVADTGVGIPESEQARIFDEFQQLKTAKQDAAEGVGLGLAICARLVEVLGGFISLQSKPGEGATFTVTLPPSCTAAWVDPPSTGPTSSAAPSNGNGGHGSLDSLRVLIAEDHEASRSALTELLTSDGASVVAVGDGLSALARLEREPFDAVVLDLMLPELDGEAVVERLERHRPGAPDLVVVVTGDMSPLRHARILGLGVDRILSKPIDLAILRELFARSAARIRSARPPRVTA